MFNGSLKQRLNFSHRRIKTTTQTFQRASNKKFTHKLDKPHQLLEKAKTAYKNQNFVQTVLQLEEFLQYKTLDNQALYICAVSYLHLNQPHEAIQKLQKITNSYPHKQQSSLLLAMAYTKVQNSQKSLQVINQCLQKYNRFEQGYCYRGKLYLKYESYNLAQKDFYYSLKLNPTSFISRVGLGDCNYQQRKYQLALKYYDQSLQFIDKRHISNISDINMKKGVCYFELQKWNDAIAVLQKLNFKQLNSQAYYYLGVSYIKINKKQKGILNLQYCIKLQAKDSNLLIQKAFKTLIQVYLNDYQFYQAINILKLTEELNNQISCKYWKTFVQGCMLIIKSYYEDGLIKLNQVYDLIKKNNNLSSHKQKIKHQHQNQFLYLSDKPLHLSDKPISSDKQIVKEKQNKRIIYNSKGRKSFSLKHVRKASFNEQTRNKTLFKTIQQKSLMKPYHNPLRSGQNKMKSFFKSIKRPHNNISLKSKISRQIFSQQQIIFIMPILLRFKGYGQYFNNNYLSSLDTYQQYQNYMKNIFGKQINQLQYNKLIVQSFLLHKTQLYKESIEKLDNSIQEYKKHYHVIPIQPLLYQISIYLKLALPYFYSNNTSLNNNNYSNQISQSNTHQLNNKNSSVQFGYQNLQHVLDINTNYNQQLKNHHLSHYYLSIMYYICQKYQDSQQQLQKTLKIVQQCSWKFLYLKGIIQILLNNYYDSIKQFTAGLILQQNADLYLGRSISFLLQGTKRKQKQQQQAFSSRKQFIRAKNSNSKIQQEKKQRNENNNSQIFIQNSFQDLQKFIQLQSNQQKISLWVTKLLFYNQAYDQASRALQKVQHKCNQLLELEFWLKFYEGQFQQCGEIGSLMTQAFEGKILHQEQQDQKVILNLYKPQINQILSYSKLNPDYHKWLIILHLFKREKYSSVIKLLQKLIFYAESFEEEIQLKYDLGIAYLMNNQINKAFSLYQSFIDSLKHHQKLKNKLIKIIQCKFQQDQCLSDLSQQLCVNGNHRVSQYLPYKSVQINHKTLKRIYIKPSIPFPLFPKPNIQIKPTKSFLQNQLELQIVQKRIQAPWIKRNKQKIQFTQQIIDAYTDFLKQTKELVQQGQQSLRFKPHQPNYSEQYQESQN